MTREIAYTDIHQALDTLLRETKVHPVPDTVPATQAYKMILSEDIVSRVDIPPMDSSHVDGFAVRAQDTKEASPDNPVSLKIVGESLLAEPPIGRVGVCEGFRVRTGSYLPKGADAVVMKEYVQDEGDRVKLFRPAQPGDEVVPAGSDIRRGERIFLKGHRLRAQDSEVLMALGYPDAPVYRKPVTAILSIGSELTEDPSQLGPGKVLSTHNVTVARMVEEAGGVPLNLGVAPDDLDAILGKLKDGLSKASMVLTIGGSSVGEADLTPRAIDMAGEPGVMVRGLKLQPGRVAGFGVVDGKPIVLLPGLIQSTVNAFIFLAYPVLRMLGGLEPSWRASTIRARMAKGLEYKRYPDFKKVTWVRVTRSRPDYEVEAIRGDSPMFNVLMRASGYILTPEHKQRIRKGERVEVNLVPGISPLSPLPEEA